MPIINIDTAIENALNENINCDYIWSNSQYEDLVELGEQWAESNGYELEEEK